jgi:hypothetical protein
MTILFSVIGLLGFRSGRMWGRRGFKNYAVEGRGVRVVGLVMLMLDLLPFVLLLLSSAFSMPALSNQLTTLGISSMFCSVILNILLYASCMAFGHRLED